ncbi:mechanosensitive ion channel [Gordonia sp. ABSL1-1]|uniref:mechanosensitive ion channel family protein n=1 Tax=Gordonia sp. ABSL1-1 TaxID=3053923 RepID=UPI0025743DAA|nr:mechanosensitive ion channel domain-containing protein [Gordonia sp. ABSL1-1]MDL9935875.1 mechanosensitive ion channel [Gordonia sp. ABSL1-1]
MTSQQIAFEWTSSNREWLIENPIRIVAYILVGLAIRFVAHRAIDRATRRPAGSSKATTDSPSTDRKPLLIRHLRERVPSSAGGRGAAQAERRAQRAATIGSVLKSTTSIVLLIWVVLSMLSVVGVNIAPFLASAGIVGLAIGFGAQNLVRDFVTGIFMLLEDQYGVGDVVDLGEAVGEVESVGLRVTTLRDVDGTLWYVRNGEIARVGNMSQEFAVARIDVPVSPSTDVEKAQHVAAGAARAAVHDDPSDIIGEVTMLGVQAVAADQVMLRLTVTTKPNAQWAVARRLRARILRAFVAEQISLPYVGAYAFAAGPNQG